VTIPATSERQPVEGTEEQASGCPSIYKGGVGGTEWLRSTEMVLRITAKGKEILNG
jgi:hypothetical protein